MIEFLFRAKCPRRGFVTHFNEITDGQIGERIGIFFSAFEDCVVLDECLAEFPQNRQRAFDQYFARRKENADALANLAVQNFIEMRDKTASRTFRAKKKLDHFLEALLPGIYLPLYTMVTFTRIPYAEAARRARVQDRIVYGSLAALTLALLIVVVRTFT